MNCLRTNSILLIVMVLSFAFEGCNNTDPTGISDISSVSGYRIGISAIYTGTSLSADGSSQAIIRVEVWNTAGQFVDNVSVTLAATIGSLASSSLTTANGIASTTFTSSVAGNATVTAMVENVFASAEIKVR